MSHHAFAANCKKFSACAMIFVMISSCSYMTPWERRTQEDTMALNGDTILANLDRLVAGITGLKNDGRFHEPNLDGTAGDYISFNSWEWPQGVGLYGIIRLWRFTGRDDLKALIEGWYERRLAAGYLPAAMASGVASIERHPDRDRAEMLAEAAAGSASPLFGYMADYAVAISSEDPACLAEIVPRLTRAGLRGYAVHGAVAEAVGLRRTGRRAEAAALTHAVWTQAGLRGRDLCGLYTAYDREVNLSARERQIAVLVARGLSPLDIASRMVLSVRTVENHILHACHKIGVDNREGLAWAACSWLTCTPR